MATVMMTPTKIAWKILSQVPQQTILLTVSGMAISSVECGIYLLNTQIRSVQKSLIVLGLG
jgi:hypothetical protein